MNRLDLLLDEQNSGYDGADALVSVLVTTCDDAGRLIDGLACAATQTHPALELIVVDDASCDGTADLARDWLRHDGHRFVRRRILRRRERRGLAQARNTGFEAACGEAVLVLDAGCCIYPRAVARLWEAMRGAGVRATYAQGLLLGETGRPIGLGAAADWDPLRFVLGDYVGAVALVDPRGWAEVGGYSDLCGREDHDFWCKFVEAGLQGLFVPELLCGRRTDDAAAHLSAEERRRVIYEMLAVHPWLELRA